MSIIDKNIVIKRTPENLIIPVWEGGILPIPDGLPVREYLLLRTVSWNEEFGLLHAEVQRDLYSSSHYEESRRVCYDLFKNLDVRKVILTNPSLHLTAAVPPRTFSDVEQTRYATKIQSTANSREEDVHRTIPTAQNKEEAIEESITVPFKKLSFEKGKVCFWHYVKRLRRELKFEIQNDFIVKEYDAIKNYFSKALATKKVDSKIMITLVEGQVISQKAESPQIDRITANLVDKIKETVFLEAVADSRADIIDFQEALEKIQKIFPVAEGEDPSSLLNELITAQKTKHVFHLGYLSTQHEYAAGNLSMTGKPMSFIFLIKHDDIFYVIWETYNTEEATYIWRINDSQSSSAVQKEYQEIKDRISHLRKGNKMAYLQTKPDGFRKIVHDYGGHDNGFKKWRDELIEFMTLHPTNSYAPLP